LHTEKTQLVSTDRFAPQSKYRDWPFALLWVLQVFAVIGLGAYYYSENKDDFNEGVKPHPTNAPGDSEPINFAQKAWTMLGISMGGAIAVSALWVFLVKQFAETLIWITLGISVLALAGGAAYMAMNEFYAGAAILGLFLLLNLLYIYLIRHRVKFSAAILSIVSHFVAQYPATVFVSFVSIFVQAIWLAIWSLFAIFAMYDSAEGSSGQEFKWFMILVSGYWTSGVIKNVVHVTAAGSFASWYFLYPGNSPKNPTSGALKRAMTTSFGSICLGSLLIAIVQAMRAMIQAAREQENTAVRACADCLLGCIESLLELFNKYAFTYCAVYGMNFCDAGRSVWELIKSKGITLVINEDLSGGVLMFGALVGGAMNAGVAFGVAHGLDLQNTLAIFWAFVGFVLGVAMTMIAFTVIESCVATLFVCFAEDPVALANTKAAEYDRLSTAWSARYPEVPMPGSSAV
jgi:hypothetical protein